MQLFKLLLICALGLMTLNACERQKQASSEVGAIPKQIIEKATNDINAATNISAQRLEAVESLDVHQDQAK
jgi:hypothetical protein